MVRKRLKANVRIEKNRVPRRIKSAIEDGMRDASYEMVEKGQDVAESRIVQRDAIWQWDLIGSFKSGTKKTPTGRIAVLENTSDHAGALEHGARYGARGPPLAPLILYLMTKGNFGGFSNRPSLRPGGGGGTGDQASADIPESWSVFDQDDLASDFDSFFYGQQVRIYDVTANQFLSGVLEGKYSDRIVVRVDGQLYEIPFDGSGNYRLIAGQAWGDLVPADQVALILDSFANSIRRTDVQPWEGLQYTELPLADRETIDAELSDYLTTGKDNRSMLRASERLEQIAQVPSNRTERGHIAQKGDASLDSENYLAMRPFVTEGGLEVDRNRHLDTYNHEFQHLWLNANGFDYDSDKHHSQLATYSRGDLLEWTVDEDGFTADYQLHRDPELFALYSHEDLNTPVEWENIVEEVPDYVDTIEVQGVTNVVENPNSTDLLNPSNPQISEGDALGVMWDNEMMPVDYEVVDSNPIQIGPDEYQYQVREVGSPMEEYLSVDGSGELFDATLDIWYDNATSTGFEAPLDGQQYLVTDMNQNPRRAYVEALNRTFYTHVWARSQEYGSGETNLGDQTKLYDGYDMTNVHETAAAMTQIMRTQVPEGDSRYVADNIEKIATVHPYLMESWLNLFEPSDLAKAELDRLGIPY